MSEINPTDLWGDINQLESLLEVIGEDLCELVSTDDRESRKHLANRAHNLLGAAQGLAGNLARIAMVR